MKPLILLTFCATRLLAFTPDVVLDSSDAATLELAPPSAWTSDTVTASAFRGAAKLLNNTVPSATQYARFHTQLPKSGPWQVFVWNNGRAGFAHAAQVSITHGDAAPTPVFMDQTVSLGQWVLAGTFWFDATKEAEVRLDHNDTGLLSANAVRFSYVEPSIVASGAAYIPSLTAWPNVTDSSAYSQSVRRANLSSGTATFLPAIPAAGSYEVSLWLPRRAGTWVPAGGTAATTFQVEITHRGILTSLTVPITDRGANEGGWVQVGTVPLLFDATPATGSSLNKIVIKTNGSTGQYVPADIVRLSKIGTYAIYMDEDDPIGPPGVTLGTLLADWFTPAVWSTARTTRAWAYYQYLPYGPRVAQATTSTLHTATYTPALPELGLYDTYLWYPYSSTNASNPLLTIHSALGDVTRTLNQTQNTGQWTHVGRYILDPTDTTLTLSTNGYQPGKYILADSVLFLRDGEELDSDGDGLPDWREVLLGTSSATTDVNGDGRPDGWDTDGDGMSDYDEWRLGRNPLKAASSGTGIIAMKLYTPTTR